MRAGHGQVVLPQRPGVDAVGAVVHGRVQAGGAGLGLERHGRGAGQTLQRDAHADLRQLGRRAGQSLRGGPVRRVAVGRGDEHRKTLQLAQVHRRIVADVTRGRDARRAPHRGRLVALVDLRAGDGGGHDRVGDLEVTGEDRGLAELIAVVVGQRHRGGTAHGQTGDRVVGAAGLEVDVQVVRQLLGQERLPLVIADLALAVDRRAVPVGVERRLAADRHGQRDVVVLEQGRGVSRPDVLGPVVAGAEAVEQVQAGAAGSDARADLDGDVLAHGMGVHLAVLQPVVVGVPAATGAQPATVGVGLGLVRRGELHHAEDGGDRHHRGHYLGLPSARDCGEAHVSPR